MAKKKKKKSKTPLIDILCSALTEAGYGFERNGWQETESNDPPNDKCSWVDINLFDEKNNMYTIHFYFTNDSTKLKSVELWVAPPVKISEDSTLLAAKIKI